MELEDLQICKKYTYMKKTFYMIYIQFIRHHPKCVWKGGEIKQDIYFLFEFIKIPLRTVCFY